MSKFISPLAFLAVLACPAFALEPGGTLLGTVGGVPVEATISPDQSDYFVHDQTGAGGGVSMVVLPLSNDSGLGMTTIGFEAVNFLAGSFNTVEMRVQIVENPSEVYAATLDDGLTAKVDEAVIEGEYLKITGSIGGTLIRGSAIDRKQRNPADSLPIMLRFSAVLEQL